MIKKIQSLTLSLSGMEYLPKAVVLKEVLAAIKQHMLKNKNKKKPAIFILLICNI